MKMLYQLAMLCLLILANKAMADDVTRLGPKCDLSIYAHGPAIKKAFLEFDSDLRAGLKKPDGGFVLHLLHYPFTSELQGPGPTEFRNSWQAHFRIKELFSPALRSIIQKQDIKDISCDTYGLYYGDKNLTVEPNFTPVTTNRTDINFEIISISGPDYKTQFVCNTVKHWIVVDSNGPGFYRYRAWNKPRPDTDAPDLEIDSGKGDVEGSGSCKHSVWKFSNDNAEYVISKRNCAEHNAPQGWKGKLDVLINGKRVESRWCTY